MDDFNTPLTDLIAPQPSSPRIASFGQPAENTDATGRIIPTKEQERRIKKPAKKPIFVTNNEYQTAIKNRNFKQNGETEFKYGLKNPYKAVETLIIANRTTKDAKKKYESMQQLEHNDQDAYRHLLLSIRLTKKYGEKEARRILDAHERKTNQSKGDRMMDLNNNEIGIRLATNPKNRHKKDIDLAEEGLKNPETAIKGYIVRD